METERIDEDVFITQRFQILDDRIVLEGGEPLEVGGLHSEVDLIANYLDKGDNELASATLHIDQPIIG